ncbi:MAG TPA: efflux RND transporter periplasmic adaptor subunit [Mariprofundaceae bacterium]|nr:efflux RND transporter periplasmic adaptor subunit [Mariprofundaceae bacterium]
MNKKTWTAAVVTLALGLSGGYWLANHIGGKPSPTASSSESPGKEKPLYYRNPMNPKITSPVPAKDEMGMDYIPVYADQQKQRVPGTVRIDPTVVQDIGVRTATATRETISHDITTMGRIAYDEQLLTRLHPKVKGWIDKLFVSETGSRVKKNTMLLALYSPELVTSEQEYLLALKNADTLKKSPFPDVRRGAEELVRSSRQRLELLDVPAHQMRTINKTRKVIKNLHIHSPFPGIVVHIGIREGEYVTPKTELYRIADLSKVWVYADIYEYELPWVHMGDKTEMHLDALPGRTFHGKITYIYPYLDPKTRTNKVRIEFDNPAMVLKPDMFANVQIRTDRRKTLVIPTEAIIRTGKTSRVFVEIGPGRFEPRDIKAGISDHGKTELLSGVREGETVVTSSQFLIDSESSLNEATAKMTAPKKKSPIKMGQPATTPAGMNMRGMKMGDTGKETSHE